MHEVHSCRIRAEVESSFEHGKVEDVVKVRERIMSPKIGECILETPVTPDPFCHCCRVWTSEAVLVLGPAFSGRFAERYVHVALV
jgi:hypothetical protein